MNGRGLSASPAVVAGCLAAAAAAVAGPDLVHSVSEKGLHGWRLRDSALELEVIQRLPDQTRAFFEARGFGADEVDRIAAACVMQAILRNVSDDVTLDVNLAEWHRTAAADTGPLRLREDWMNLWEEGGAAGPARIALYWALFPTRQRFAPGDYNWGKMSFALTPGTDFDLNLVWRENAVRHEAVIPGIRCAADD